MKTKTYLTGKQINFLRDLIYHLQGRLEFVDYIRRHRTATGNRNGEIFNIFGDEWTFIVYPHEDQVQITIALDKISKPGESPWDIDIFDFPYNMEEISEFIYNYYFKS